MCELIFVVGLVAAKFLRFGVPAAAVTEPRLQAMAAAALGAGDVVIAVSGSGRITELLKSVDAALAAGATVIALSPSHSPLAKRASQTACCKQLCRTAGFHRLQVQPRPQVHSRLDARRVETVRLKPPGSWHRQA